MNKKQNLTDRNLILQYLEGDDSMLPALVKRYHKIFCEKAFWITRDKEMAKDVAQESWIIIIRKLYTLRNTDQFKSWALRIVFTKAIDGLKRRNKERVNLPSSLVTETEKPIKEEDVIQRELLKAIKELPQGKQEIIRLFYMEEYSIREISVSLNIPVGTVKSRLFKAREKLKSIIKINKS